MALGQLVAFGICQTEFKNFMCRRHIKRPEHPVPDRKHLAIILVMMARGARVVDLMLCRRNQDVFQNTPIAESDMSVAQV